jgi:hypothetical protein
MRLSGHVRYWPFTTFATRSTGLISQQLSGYSGKVFGRASPVVGAQSTCAASGRDAPGPTFGGRCVNRMAASSLAARRAKRVTPASGFEPSQNSRGTWRRFRGRGRGPPGGGRRRPPTAPPARRRRSLRRVSTVRRGRARPRRHQVRQSRDASCDPARLIPREALCLMNHAGRAGCPNFSKPPR